VTKTKEEGRRIKRIRYRKEIEMKRKKWIREEGKWTEKEMGA
jgi:hypothetical protein